MLPRSLHFCIAGPTFSRRLAIMLMMATMLYFSSNYSSGQEIAQTFSRTPVYTRDGSEACLLCHFGEKMRAVSNSVHGNAKTPGTPAATHGCEACHGPGSIHISRAHGGKGFPLLTRFGRPDASSPREEQLNACLSCHADRTSSKKQVTFTGSPHDRTRINCSSCHVAHAEFDPMNNQAEQLKTCNRCHRRHIRDHPEFNHDGTSFHELSCSTCHDVHTTANQGDQEP